MATANTNNNNISEKKYIMFPVIFSDGKVEKTVDYIIESEKGYSRKTGLFQLEGHLYVPNEKSSTGYANVNRWIWGMQPKKNVPKKNWMLWKTSGGEPIVWSSDKISDDFNIALAEAIMGAYKTGEGVIDCPFKKPAKKQAVVKTASVMEEPPAPCDADAPDAVEDEDEAILDGMGESPLVRLNAGDPTFFTELGMSEGHARRFAKWIHENSISFNSISDVIKIQGIGKMTQKALVDAYNEKYSA